jgi:hypothetical protein
MWFRLVAGSSEQLWRLKVESIIDARWSESWRRRDSFRDWNSGVVE